MKLKIGTIYYEVSVVPKEELDDCEGSYLGTINYRASTVKILDEFTPEAADQALWHEIVHALSSQHNLELDEGQVDALAHGLVCVINANPKWWKSYVSEQLALSA